MIVFELSLAALTISHTVGLISAVGASVMQVDIGVGRNAVLRTERESRDGRGDISGRAGRSIYSGQ